MLVSATQYPQYAPANASPRIASLAIDTRHLPFRNYFRVSMDRQQPWLQQQLCDGRGAMWSRLMVHVLGLSYKSNFNHLSGSSQCYIMRMIGREILATRLF
jgi:hypothetical protein